MMMNVISGPIYVFAIATVRVFVGLALLRIGRHTAYKCLIATAMVVFTGLGFLQYLCELTDRLIHGATKVPGVIEHSISGRYPPRCLSSLPDRSSSTTASKMATAVINQTHFFLFVTPWGSSEKPLMLTFFSHLTVIFQCSNPAMR